MNHLFTYDAVKKCSGHILIAPSPELLLCPLTLSPPAPSLSAEGSSGSQPVEPHWSAAAAAVHQAPFSWTPAGRKSYNITQDMEHNTRYGAQRKCEVHLLDNVCTHLAGVFSRIYSWGRRYTLHQHYHSSNISIAPLFCRPCLGKHTQYTFSLYG